MITFIKKHWIYILIALAVAAAAFYFLYLKPKKEAKKQEEEKEEETPSAKPSSPVARDKFPLKNGSKGARVKTLQENLNRLYNAGLQADGVYGSLTQAAAKKHLGTITVSERAFNDLNRKSIELAESIKKNSLNQAGGMGIPFLSKVDQWARAITL